MIFGGKYYVFGDVKHGVSYVEGELWLDGYFYGKRCNIFVGWRKLGDRLSNKIKHEDCY